MATENNPESVRLVLTEQQTEARPAGSVDTNIYSQIYRLSVLLLHEGSLS